MTPEISVIMPVYNQEAYLDKALESLCRQTFRDFELIIVNDGSTDRSEEIIRKYTGRLPAVNYISQPNAGVAAARQAGVDAARGNYMIHVDPDDWVEPDYLEKLHGKALETGADIVLCNYIEEYRKKDVPVDVAHFTINNFDDFKIITAHIIWSSLWNRLIRSSCIKGKVNFEPGLNYQEDRVFFWRVLQEASSVAFVDAYLYHYNRHNRHSMVNNQSKSNLVQMWRASRLIWEAERDPAMKLRLEELLSKEGVTRDLLKYPGITPEEFRSLTEPFHANIRQRLERDIPLYRRKLKLKKLRSAKKILAIIK